MKSRFALACAGIVALTAGIAAGPLAASQLTGDVVFTKPASSSGQPSQGKNPVTASASTAKPGAKLTPGQLRDKMPYFSEQPSLVGNDLVFALDVDPMRDEVTKGPELLDRIGGSLVISRKGIDLRDPSQIDASSQPAGKALSRNLQTRTVKTSGAQQYRIALPKAVAASLRNESKRGLAHRVRVVMWNDKDTDPTAQGYDRRQVMGSFAPPYITDFLASRRLERAAASEGGATRSLTRSAASANNASTYPGTVLIYNGSPFDLDMSFNNVQCMDPYLGYYYNPGQLASNQSYEFFQAAMIASDGNYWSSDIVNQQSTRGMTTLEKTSLSALSDGALVYHITDDFSRGLMAFGSKMAFALTLGAVEGAVANSNACTDAGSAISLAWTNTSVGANQSAGNVSYYVPSYNRTTSMQGSMPVSPTSLPAVAPGSPLTAYLATSGNGLAVPASSLQSQLGMGGSVTLTTLNSNQQNGSYNGFWCNFRNQQAPNPNGANSSAPYGSTALAGGTAPDWGPCNATGVTGSPDNVQSQYMDGNADNLENEGLTILVGYSSTATATAGPYAVSPGRSAANGSLCTAGSAPCIYTTPSTAANPALTIGCTPGDWNLLTPWNGANISLSSPPSAYSASSMLSTQLAYTGVTAAGAPITDSVPSALYESSFSPDTVNTSVLNADALSDIQASLGGAGGYVTNWLCVMTAYTLVPGGIAQFAPAATAMNLGWYGTPVVASVPNPAGNLLSPPS